MRRFLLLAAALAAPISSPAAPYAYTMSGDQFVSIMSKPDPTGHDYMNREKAYSYLNGVRDSSEGRVWCDRYQFKTPDMAYDLAGEIAKLPASERKKNASLLLLELLKRNYPCQGSKR